MSTPYKMKLTLAEVATLILCPRATWRLWRAARMANLTMMDMLFVARMRRKLDGHREPQCEK